MTKKHISTILVAVIFSVLGYIIADGLLSATFKDDLRPNKLEERKNTKREKAFNAASFELQNGMRVVLIENHRAPIVSHMLWYKVGAADEDWGNSGLAHFFEHLMFKGTQNLEPGEYSRTVRALGGSDNAFTGQDFTSYFVNIAVENLETVMRMEADRMVNLDIPEEHFLSERNVILEERAQRTDTNPSARMMETLRATLYPNHAYGVPVIGWREEIAALQHDEAMAFYDKWYAPNNAILVIAGAITREELEPLTQEIYGRIPAKATATGPEYIAPILPGDKNISYEDAQVQQPSFLRLCRVPSYTTDKQAALALSVAANILDGGAATRLYKSIVSEQKLASNVSLSFSGYARKESTAYISAIPRDGVSLADLEKAIDSEIAKYISSPPDEIEIREAKDRLINSAIYARDSLQTPAYIFGQALTTGLEIDDVEYWTDDVEKLSDDDIRSAITHITDSKRCVNGRLLPKGGDPALIEQVNIKITPKEDGGSDE